MVQPAGAAAVVVVRVTMGVPEEKNPAQHRVTSINQHPNSGKWHGPSEQHGTRRVQGGMKLIQEEEEKKRNGPKSSPSQEIKPKSGKPAGSSFLAASKHSDAVSISSPSLQRPVVCTL